MGTASSFILRFRTSTTIKQAFRTYKLPGVILFADATFDYKAHYEGDGRAPSSPPGTLSSEGLAAAGAGGAGTFSATMGSASATAAAVGGGGGGGGGFGGAGAGSAMAPLARLCPAPN